MTELATLHSAWDVDRHIVLDSADKLVLVRFSSYCSSAAEIADYMEMGSQRGAPSPTLSSSSSPSSLLTAQRKRPREEDDAVPQLSAAAALLINNADEHYLRTRQMDALLREMAPKIRKYCTIFLVDTREVTAFNEMYELGHDRDPFAVMFFYRNRHIRVDVGTGNNNKVNFFAFEDMYDFLPIVDAAYKAGKQGRSITSCDKKFSTVALRR